MQANKQFIQEINPNIIPTSVIYNSLIFNKSENIKNKTKSENKIEYYLVFKKELNMGMHDFNRDCFDAIVNFSALFRSYMSISELESLEGRIRLRVWVCIIQPLIKMQNTFDPTTVLDAQSLIIKATEVLKEFEILKSKMLNISKYGTKDSKDINEDKRIATLLVEGFDIVMAELQYSIASMGEQATLEERTLGEQTLEDQASIQERHILQERLKLSTDVFVAINKYAEQGLSE